MLASRRSDLLAARSERSEQAVPKAPVAWSVGISHLLDTSSPSSVDPHRWARFRADAERVLIHHGTELHAAGWDTLDVFGLHAVAPEHRPDAAGLAWLLRGRGVGRITAETVEIVTRSGATLRTWRVGQQARREAVLAWELR